LKILLIYLGIKNHVFKENKIFFKFSLQIKSISISFVLGLSGGDHSLQRLISSRIASKLSIDTIYDSSARKYYEYIIKSVNEFFFKKTNFSEF
jgi:hypothetical protein